MKTSELRAKDVAALEKEVSDLLKAELEKIDAAVGRKEDELLEV